MMLSVPEKDLWILGGAVKTPPMSREARKEVGGLLRMLQRGHRLSMPVSRPMPGIGPRCHELRVPDGDVVWRVFYRLDEAAVLVLEVLKKKTQKTPKSTIDVCKARLKEWEREQGG